MKADGVKMKPIVMLIAGLFPAMGYVAIAGATGLPANVTAAAQALGITVGTDGSLGYGGATFVPLLPPGYSPAQQPSGDPVGRADGSVVWGNLQFAPVVQTPGELPHLPDNLQPLAGNSLPPDFSPPAGFVPTSSVPLPSGVTVPPLTASAMVQQMVTAGALPAGLVQFNSDGTLAVNGGSSYLPFLPPTAQQGLARDPTVRSIQIEANGSVTFPDGSTFAPLVSGATAGGTTLPSGFTPPAGTSLPATVGLPPQFEIPSTVQIPSGMTLPVGVVIPSGYSIPTGTTLPPGVNIPTGTTLPPGVTVPKGITLPVGTQLSSNAALPQGTTVLPSGAVVIPGDKIPTGVTPPASWTPPTGATRGADGSYSLPTPPATGFPPPPMPLRVNADGSAVMPAPAAGAPPPPPGSVVNADGTITIPPPPFIGSVGSGGVVQGPGFGVMAPAGFTPQIPTGTALPGAGSMPSGCMAPPTGTLPGTFADLMPPPPGSGGSVPPPPDSTTSTGGTTMPPPDGTTTIPPPGGTTMPPGGTVPTGGNPLGGITC